MVGKDKIEITAELKDLLTGQLKKIQDEAAKLDNALKNIGNGGAIGKGGGGGSGMGARMHDSIMGSVLGANLLTNAIMGTGNAIKNFAVGSIDAYQKQENYEARLTTLLGSRKAAELDIMNLRQDAAKTPFDLDSLVQVNSMLIGAGESANGARKATMDLGNAIAATGGKSDELNRVAVNMAQIKAIGKASQVDIKQFAFAGITNIYEILGKSMHKSKEEIKGMDISYKDLTKAFAEARKEGGAFYKGLENASNTLTGLRSNLDDVIEGLQANIGETWADALKDTIRGILPMLDDINKGMTTINSTAKTLNKEGLGFGLMEGTGTKGPLAILKKRLDEEVMAASSGDDIQSKRSELTIKNYLKNLSEKYAADKEIADATGEGSPDAKNYLRQVALVKDALNSIKELKGAGGNKDAGSNAEATGKKESDLEKVAKANRPTQVNINIENLVREFTNNLATANEVLKLTPEEIAKVLISAVNDVSKLNYT